MLRFKRNRTVIMLDQFRKMDQRLQFISLSMMGFSKLNFGKDLIVTEIFRTRAQQELYYPDQPYKPSVHQFGRGIDFGIRAYGEQELAPVEGVDMPYPGLTDNEITLLDEWYSGMIAYDDERPEYDSLVHHNVGLGDHLHLQVSWRNSTKIRSDSPTLYMLAQRLGITM